MARVLTGSRRRGLLLLVAAASLAGALWLATAALLSPTRHSPTGFATHCDLSATPSSFPKRVAAAKAGQTICLGAGDYGTWQGTNKAITIAGDRGREPTMNVSLGEGDSGFTLEHIGGMGGSMTGAVADVTIRDSTFTSPIDIVGATHNVVLDHNRYDWMVRPSAGGANAKIFVNVEGTLASPAVTIENSEIENGDLDGVHIGGGSGVVVQGNVFRNLCDMHANHTDNIQFEGGAQIRISANYLYASQHCMTQGITSYDGYTNGVTIEDNVVDIPRDWGIELYSDRGSIVRHNTVVYHPPSYSEFGSGTGHIDIDRKSADPAGSGTRVYDNLARVAFANGSTGAGFDNVSSEGAVYVGPPTSRAGFKLSATSPVGIKAASDKLDAGVRISRAN